MRVRPFGAHSLVIDMTYAKDRNVGAIHELPLRWNAGFKSFLRKS